MIFIAALKKYWKLVAGAVLLITVAVMIGSYLSERDADNQNIGFDDAVTKTNDSTDKLKEKVKKHVDKTKGDVAQLDCDAVNDELFVDIESYQSESGDCESGDLSRGVGVEEAASNNGRYKAYEATKFGEEEGIGRVRKEPQGCTVGVLGLNGCICVDVLNPVTNKIEKGCY